MGAALSARALATDLSIFVTLSRIRVLPHPPRELTVLRAGAYVHGRMLPGRVAGKVVSE